MSTPEPPPRRPIVLVVEDEPSLRRLAVRLLGDEGYEVLEAGDGLEALGLASRLGPALDLLITDVRLPGLAGPELAAQLRSRRPGLPVLFVSGMRDSHLASHGLTEGDVGLLLKPFRIEELVDQAARLTGGRGPAARRRPR